MQKNFLFGFSIHFHILFFFLLVFCSLLFVHAPFSSTSITRFPFIIQLRSGLFCSIHNVSKTSCLSFSFYFDIPIGNVTSQAYHVHHLQSKLLENQLTALHLFVFLLNLHIIHKFSIRRDKAKIGCQLFAQCTYEFIKTKYKVQPSTKETNEKRKRKYLL